MRKWSIAFGRSNRQKGMEDALSHRRGRQKRQVQCIDYTCCPACFSEYARCPSTYVVPSVPVFRSMRVVRVRMLSRVHMLSKTTDCPNPSFLHCHLLCITSRLVYNWGDHRSFFLVTLSSYSRHGTCGKQQYGR
jgi:hypothetical protein